MFVQVKLYDWFGTHWGIKFWQGKTVGKNEMALCIINLILFLYGNHTQDSQPEKKEWKGEHNTKGQLKIRTDSYFASERCN